MAQSLSPKETRTKTIVDAIRSLQKFSHSTFDFHVDTYGALGDGSTDDKTAIQTAINAAIAVGGGRVIFGPKTYAVGSNVSVASAAAPVTLMGCGIGVTILKRSVNSSYKVFSASSTDGLRLSGITFDANGTALTSNTHAVDIAQCDYTTILDCEFKDAASNDSACLLVTGNSSTPNTDVHIHRCIFDTGAVGALISYHNHSGFFACHAKNISGSPGFGIQLKNEGNFNYMIANTAEDSDVAFVVSAPDTGNQTDSVLRSLRADNCVTGMLINNSVRVSGGDIRLLLNGVTGYGVHIQQNSQDCEFDSVSVVNGHSAVRFASSSFNNRVTLSYAADQGNYVARFDATSYDNTVIHNQRSVYSDANTIVAETLDSGEDSNVYGAAVIAGMIYKKFRQIITLDTGDAETSVGLTPNGVIEHAAIRVSTEITDLDSADHHIQLGVSGTTDKYINVANGSAATSISANVKDNYVFDPSTGVETAALILTITGGSDNTPSAGAVEVEIVYRSHTDLADG